MKRLLFVIGCLLVITGVPAELRVKHAESTERTEQTNYTESTGHIPKINMIRAESEGNLYETAAGRDFYFTFFDHWQWVSSNSQYVGMSFSAVEDARITITYANGRTSSFTKDQISFGVYLVVYQQEELIWTEKKNFRKKLAFFLHNSKKSSTFVPNLRNTNPLNINGYEKTIDGSHGSYHGIRHLLCRRRQVS